MLPNRETPIMTFDGWGWYSPTGPTCCSLEEARALQTAATEALERREGDHVLLCRDTSPAIREPNCYYVYAHFYNLATGGIEYAYLHTEDQLADLLRQVDEVDSGGRSIGSRSSAPDHDGGRRPDAW